MKTLQTQSSQLLLEIQTLIQETCIAEQTNEQWFLNFLDELNKLSISY